MTWRRSLLLATTASSRYEFSWLDDTGYLNNIFCKRGRLKKNFISWLWKAGMEICMSANLSVAEDASIHSLKCPRTISMAGFATCMLNKNASSTSSSLTLDRL
jgi:hypothetical protein